VTIGPRASAQIAAHRLWSRHRSLGLRVDLEVLPPRPTARVAVEMVPVALSGFAGFEDALAAGDGESVELLRRELLRRRGVETLFVAHAAQDRPIFAEWLVLADRQEPLHLATGGLYPPLAAGEALAEGAYTFPAFRGRAAMADGLWQLLARARDAGAHTVYTYVSPDNVPSLKSCARAGFVLHHVRIERRRAGRTRISRVRPDAAAHAAWAPTRAGPGAT
jgi:RimJ/RimL family protein N-acetyltransferase